MANMLKNVPGLQDLMHSDNSGGGNERRYLTMPIDETCMKEGFLQKKGQMLKGWKQRWFVCDGRTLSYYGHRRDSKPNVVLPLRFCVVEDGGKSETWNSRRIHLTDNSAGITYCLSSEDGQVVREWLTVLQNAIAKASRARTTHVASTGATTAATTAPSAAGSGAIKRANRLESAPVVSQPAAAAATTMQEHQQPSHQEHQHPHEASASSKPVVHQRASTTVALENEIARDVDVLKSMLLSTRGQVGTIVFFPLGSVNGVLKSLGVDRKTRRVFARGSVVLPLPSEVAAYYICDHHRRAEWDVQFPVSTHVATLDHTTEIVHLGKGIQQFTTTKSFVSTELAAGIGAVVGGLLAPSWSTMLSNMAVIALIAAVVNQMNFSSLCAPRDLVIVRHIRKCSAGEEDEMSHSGEVPSITILEKSVVNERRPEIAGVVRACQPLGGWIFEPLDRGRTLVKYLTNFDAGGWVSAATKQQMLIDRLECLSVLREYVDQSQLSPADLGLDEEDESEMDESQPPSSADDDHAQPVSGAKFHPDVYMKEMVRMPTGGLKLTDKEVAKKQAGVVREVLKSASAVLLEGKGMVSLSLPVRIFEPRTNLERVVDLFLYAPTFLNVAADQTDPVERFKYVIAFAMAGIHHGVGQLKPFNPILGETFQALLNDGTEVFCEHTSHHPPISNFELLGAKYTISGFQVFNSPKFSMKSSAFVQHCSGPIRVGFHDGTVVQYQMPLMQCGGFLWGDRTVEMIGVVHFEDKKNHLECDLKFHPDEKKGMGGMFSSSATPSDYVRGVIVDTSTESELSAVSGSWLDGVEFDNKPYWVMGRERSGFVLDVPVSQQLESDSRNREDLRYLAANDMDLAQEWKVRLEVLQRADRKARLDGRHANHWTSETGAH